MSSPSAAPAKDPWDRLDGESSKAFAAFEFYRRLGINRSLDEVARRHWGSGEAPSGRRKPVPGKLKVWSARFGWVERAAAWDAHEARIRREAEEQNTRRIAGETCKLRLRVLDKVGRTLEKAIDKADVYLSFPEAAQTVREDGDRKITTVNPINVLDAQRATTIVTKAVDRVVKVLDRLEELTRPKAKTLDELVTPETAEGAETVLRRFRREMALDSFTLSEPPDDEPV